MEGRGIYADGEPRRFGMATQTRGQSSNPFLWPDSGSSGFSSDQDVFGDSVRSELAPGVADREFVRALLESNRTMQRILVQQQQQQQEQQQALAAALTRIVERDPPQFVVQQAASPPVLPRVTREALEQIAELKGGRGMMQMTGLRQLKSWGSGIAGLRRTIVRPLHPNYATAQKIGTWRPASVSVIGTIGAFISFWLSGAFLRLISGHGWPLRKRDGRTSQFGPTATLSFGCAGAAHTP